MKDEGGETTEGREGSRGNGAKGGGKPPPLALSRPFFRSPHSALLPSPSLVFSIPSEVTTACLNKRRYRAARGVATATPLEVTLTCWERGRKDKGRGYSGQRGEPGSRAKGSGIPQPLAFCGSCFRSPRLPASAPPSSFHPL